MLEFNNILLRMVKQWAAAYANTSINMGVGLVTHELTEAAIKFAKIKKFAKCTSI